jgi:pilus assembly protein CpaE
MSTSLLVASSDERFRESIQDNLVNIPNAKIAAVYPEVSSTLYIRVLQDLERNHNAGLIVDLSGDPENALKAVEKVKQAAPDLYVIASNFHADGETVIASVRAGANDFLIQPVKRADFRDVITRLERAPKRSAPVSSRLGKIYSFLGAKGGVGTTTLAVNFAGVMAQQKHQTVLVDLDSSANDCVMQLGTTPAHSLQDVGDNLTRLDQALFEGLAYRDPLGFQFIGPTDQMEQRMAFSEPMFREFADFLVEKYDSVVVDAGRWLTDDVVLAALQSSTAVFLVLTQEFPAIRNAQRYIASLMRIGFSQDQLKIVVNRYQKKPETGLATIEQIRQTLNMPTFGTVLESPAALGAVNRGRPAVAEKQGDLDRAYRKLVDKITGKNSDAGKEPAAQTA